MGISLDGQGTKGPYNVDKRTKDMSLTHMKDTLEYNLRHAEEHLKAARETCEKLDKIDPKHEVPVSKQLLSHMDYFEEAVGHDQAEHKLKEHIKNNY